MVVQVREQPSVPPTHIHLVFYLTYAVGANLYGVSTLADTAILPPILYFLVWGWV